MYTLRCTQKLLQRGVGLPTADVPQHDTLLGDWYATVIACRPRHLVLAVSERTLLPVLLPAREGRTLVARLPLAVAEMLGSLGIAAGEVDREVRAMAPGEAQVGRTASRRLLGTLKELVFELEVVMPRSPEQTLLAWAQWLAHSPLKVIDYESPERATRALFQARRVWAAAAASAAQPQAPGRPARDA